MQDNRNRIYRVDGIVLSRRDWGEADRLVTLLTADRGKIRAIAPGARKPLSRKSGHLELFSRGRFVLARGRTFDKITQAETHLYFPRLRESLPRISAAYLLVELVDRFLQEQDVNVLVYELLTGALQALDAGDAPALVLRYFEVKLLSFVGFQPQLHACARCDERLEPVDQFFSPADGGVLCPLCQQTNQGGQPLSLPLLKVLRLMQSADWETVRRLRLPPEQSDVLARLLNLYLAYMLERELRATRFIEEVRQSAGGENE